MVCENQEELCRCHLTSYPQIALLAAVYSETTSLTVLFLRVSVEGLLSSAVAFSMLKLFFPRWRWASDLALIISSLRVSKTWRLIR